MTASQQNLQKLIDLYRLRELYILKDNIGLEFSNMHFNKPARKIQHRMNLLVKDKINHRVDGTGLKYNKYELLEGIVDGALKQQTRTLVKQPNKFTRHALKDNTKNYEKFFQKRLNIEDTRIDSKIEEAIKSLQKEKLTGTELKKQVYKKVEGTGTSKLQNIIRDSLHTNQARLSFTKALEDGHKYKIWMNGRIIGLGGGNKNNKKSRTRPWHIASKIHPVLLEDMFDIYGSYHAQLMYPGDLNGGAENVANCRCWLKYTDTRPDGFKRKKTVNKNYHDVFHNTKKKKDYKNPLNKSTDTLEKIKNIPSSISNTIRRLVENKKNYGSIFASYEYKNIKIIKEKGVNYINNVKIEKIVSSIPNCLTEKVKTIHFHGFPLYLEDGNRMVLGMVRPDLPFTIHIFQSNNSFDNQKNTIVHECAHIFDENYFNEISISNSKKWEEAFKLDKEHNINNSNFIVKDRGYFVSTYAKDRAEEYKKQGFLDYCYNEDFADSVMRYLDENDKKFRDDYPNRCKILNKILGV